MWLGVYGIFYPSLIHQWKRGFSTFFLLLVEVSGQYWVQFLFNTIHYFDNFPLQPRLPSELTAAGMVLRVSLIVDRLNTCDDLPVWPPPSALREKIGKGELEGEGGFKVAHVSQKSHPTGLTKRITW